MRKFIPLLAALALSACSSLGNQAFSGESATLGSDNILRDDVLKVVRTAEAASFNCRNIESVHSKINSAHKVHGRMQVREVWTVRACGQAHRYNIGLFEDARGETDFTVGLISR